METIRGGMHIVGPMPIAPAYHQRIENMVNNLNAGVRQPGFRATADREW